MHVVQDLNELKLLQTDFYLDHTNLQFFRHKEQTPVVFQNIILKFSWENLPVFSKKFVNEVRAKSRLLNCFNRWYLFSPICFTLLKNS